MYKIALQKIKGQALPFILLIFAVVLSLVFANIERINMISKKIQYQKQTDAIAMAITNEYTQSLNAIAASNRGIKQLYKELKTYNAVLWSGTIIMVGSCLFFGLGCTFAPEIASLHVGKDKLKAALKDAGDVIDKQIKYFDDHMFDDMCNQLRAQRILLIQDFLSKQRIEISDLEIDHLIHATRNKWITIKPNICNRQVVQSIKPFERRPGSKDEYVECQEEAFDNWSSYNQHMSEGAFRQWVVHVDALYLHPSRDPQQVFVYQRDIGQVEQEKYFSFQHEEREDPFRFSRATVKACIDESEEIKRSGIFPDYAHLLPQTYQRNRDFLITTHIPYVPASPFSSANDLLSFTQQNSLQEIISYLNNIQSITTVSQVRIQGDSLMQMKFLNTLTEETLYQPSDSNEDDQPTWRDIIDVL